MNKLIRDAQLKALKAFAKTKSSFALAGGTALELFYLKHRFSRDLDFFSPKYNLREIKQLVASFSAALEATFTLESEFVAPGHARVRFYSGKIKGCPFPLKIDFIEDVLFKKPQINRFKGARVYNVKNIYIQKIIALTGSRPKEDEIGRETVTGRQEARDVFDIYCLSEKVEPLHRFMKRLGRQYQRGIVQWYRSYSRQDLKLGILDLEIYLPDFDVTELIGHFDKEINLFITEEIT
jgi:predicted nucleotidyltransferase component of viral defense system